ncbi:MAG: molecular chaperone DnaK, partial [Anaerolineae bacterium]|nr:molecular chaperone DnaK [Anaerolineae bacterium]
AELRSQVESKIEGLKTVINSDDTPAMKQQSEELGQLLQQVGASMYQEAGPGAPPPPDSDEPPAGGDEDVIDAEFSEA